MDLEQIIQLIDRVSASGLTSFEYEAGGVRLAMECSPRAQAGSCAQAQTGIWPEGYLPAASCIPASAPGGQADPGQGKTVTALAAASEDSRMEPGKAPEAAGVENAASAVVKSPLVGIFYSAQEEKARPFVQVGDRVKKGQVLAIVEAMKLMNEIESDYDGEITEIYVKDGEPVEYGQPLFAVRL